jgi:uncharacterized membrane protein
MQLVVIGFAPDAQFRGDIIRELTALRGRGVVRLIDAMFIRKDADGKINAAVHESDLTLHERELLGAIVGGILGLAAGGDSESEALGATLAAQSIAEGAFGLGIADLQRIKDQLPAGSAALLLLIEHQWALELKGAVRNAGGVPIVQGFLTPEALFMVGEELQVVAQAKRTIALAETAQAVAILSTLAVVEAADEIQQAAVAETARVLIAAGLIEEAATQDVINTLVAADLIKQEALAEARATVEASQANGAALQAAQTNGAAQSADTPEDKTA